jgi:stearoyl-CoA desaturase (delta-9 desaturase)
MCKATDATNEVRARKVEKQPESDPNVSVENISPWTEREVNWSQTIYLGLCHIGAILGLHCIWAGDFISYKTLAWAVALHFLSGLGITGGVHRLWAHRSYTAALPFRIFLTLCVQIANQGSILHWVRDHRVHHLCSETPADPHDAMQGFLFAHIGWLLVKKDPRVVEKGKTIDFSDLMADPCVVIDKALFPFSQLFMCFIAPPLVAVYGWDENKWAAFLICGFLRYVMVLHNTWTVNSVAHLFGDMIHDARPYDENINPSENLWVTLMAHGEGWHNYHHSYPQDYSASEHGWMKQYNPTTATIDLMAAIGLVTNRKKATKQWEARKARKAATATH